jgi:NADPH:quinone reductase-like Zn-dependent oxidoreductase
MAALARLAHMVAEKRLRVPIAAVLPWTSVDAAAVRLVGQTVDGKIVMEIT